MIRVAVTGSECTGKTTLAQALARHYDAAMAPEFVREWVAAAGRAPRAGDVEAIAHGQLAAEERAAAQGGRLVVLDTDLMSTLVYSRHYYGDCPAWVDRAVSARAADLYLLANIDVPWQPDGPYRDRGHLRGEMQRLFRDELERRQLAFVNVRGDHETRMATATRAVDRLLGC